MLRLLSSSCAELDVAIGYSFIPGKLNTGAPVKRWFTLATERQPAFVLADQSPATTHRDKSLGYPRGVCPSPLRRVP